MNQEEIKVELLSKTSDYIDDAIMMHNALTGDNQFPLDKRLKYSMKQATHIDIIVSFLMESGVKHMLNDLEQAVKRGVKIRLLTGNYLGITEPSALYLIREALGQGVELRFYNIPNKSFHPKAYFFHKPYDSELYIGSSNLSRGALTSSIEWNYRFDKSSNVNDFEHFYNTFEDLFYQHATIIDDEVLRAYSKNWCKPRVFSNRLTEEAALEKDQLENNIAQLFEPRGAQIEALYALERTREEGWDRGLVVAATGIGKTYLAAFDSKPYKRILFVGHREEILKQAFMSFKNVRHTDKLGFFYNSQKDKAGEVIFALVQTLGKKEYLNKEYFSPQDFDYIIIDECHHATAKQYEAIRDYFTPTFWLFLTATPERMDNEDVFAIANWNTVYEVRLKEAINKDWLVPFRYYGIYDYTVDYETINQKQGKYDKEALEKNLMIEKRGALVFGHYKKYDSKRAMGFCSSKAHAAYMAKYFTEEGIPAVAVYSGEQGEMNSQRDEALQKLASGEINVVFSVDMFNEGIDVPSIDMVMFLRPTESPTVFLQQLGRGLRKYRSKHYLNVLDFIGNYKKAQFIPFLLGDKAYSAKEGRTLNPQTMEMPEGCYIDFDFRLIDMFKEMSNQELKLKEHILLEYERIKDEIGSRPTRVELLTKMDASIYFAMKRKSKENILNDYLGFLEGIESLDEDEKQLYHTYAGDFLKEMSTTSMSRTYKMPLLLAFYNKGNIRQAVTKAELVEAFKTFYQEESNNIDLLQDESKKDYRTWDDKKWFKLIKENPIKAFLSSGSMYFEEKEGYELALNPRVVEQKNNACFKKHLKDIIEFKLKQYYRERFAKNQ